MYDFNQRQLEKLQRLRDNGINPYPNGLEVTERIDTLVNFGEELSAEELESVAVEFSIAGRLRFKNLLGKIGFGRIQQDEARVQICVKKQVTDPESFKAFKSLDVGDWVWARGTLFRTKTGELTLLATELKLYAKCIEGMPDKKVGVNNPETRQRMRYLDLIVNDDVMETFKARSYIIRYIRNFLEYQGFIGVETPILQAIPGGASAKPFMTHHNSLDTDMYMRVAPELYLKRLLVGGFEKVYEIGKNFRNEGISTRHNPEFTMVEFYQAHATYKDLIKLTQNMIVGLVMEMYGGLKIPYGELSLDFSAWGEVRYDEAIRAVGVEDPWDAYSILSFLEQTISSDRLGDFREATLSDLQQLIFDEYVEPQLVNPTFVTHYPTEISPLARMNEDEPRVTDRFELFIAGQEIANGFSELNDPVDQADRFAAQAERKADGDEEAMYFDADYIKALSYGMPPAAGEGIGIDRLVMLLTNKQSIREVVLFPTLRRT